MWFNTIALPLTPHNQNYNIHAMMRKQNQSFLDTRNRGTTSVASAKASKLFPGGTIRPQAATTFVTDDLSEMTDDEKAHARAAALRKADATDMSLVCSMDGHMATVRTAVKEKLFPVNKFITSNSSLDYHPKEGICAYMLHACSVTSNSRAWWNHYKHVVKRTLANHRNNRIKAMQQLFIGKY